MHHLAAQPVHGEDAQVRVGAFGTGAIFRVHELLDDPFSFRAPVVGVNADFRAGVPAGAGEAAAVDVRADKVAAVRADVLFFAAHCCGRVGVFGSGARGNWRFWSGVCEEVVIRLRCW